MITKCNQKEFEFQGIKSKKVLGKFNGGEITSDAGALLLRGIEKKTKIIEKFSQAFIDHRNKEYIEHSVKELLSQRVFGIAMGYEDLNDHDYLRKDQLLAIISGKEDITGSERKHERDKGKPLAGKSTLNRIELTKENVAEGERYKKISYDNKKVKELFVEVFLTSRGKEPKQIVLDLDTTDDRIHGKQEGRYYHGYYGDYCYLPLYIFCGEDLLCAKLNTSDKGAGKDAVEEVSRIVKQIREKWKYTHIIIRGDSDFSKNDIMKWCEENEVDFILGIRKNDRLIEEISEELKQAKEQYEETGETQRIFKEFYYETLKNTWSRKRRIIGKAEHLEKGTNPRFIVTSLTDNSIKQLYEDLYCERGDMENRIKEQQLYLFADRTSAHEIRANQLRLNFASIAYLFMAALRKLAVGTEWAKAQCHTLRNKVLKIGAQINISVRRIYISFTSSYPYQQLFALMHKRLMNAT